MTKLSVVIVTTSLEIVGLRRILISLKSQSLNSTEWELIVINYGLNVINLNNIDLCWQPNIKFVNEPNGNLISAKFAGIHLAKNEIIFLLETSGILSKDYLKNLVKLATEKPYLGVFYGEVRPEFTNNFNKSFTQHQLLKFFPSLHRTTISNSYKFKLEKMCLVIKSSIAKDFIKSNLATNELQNSVFGSEIYQEVLDIFLYNFAISKGYLGASFHDLAHKAIVNEMELTNQNIESYIVKRLTAINLARYIFLTTWPSGLGLIRFLWEQTKNLILVNKIDFYWTRLERVGFLNSIPIALELRKYKIKNNL